MAAVQKIDINKLQLNCQNAILVGVIINSLNPKNFEPSNQKYGSGGMRGVWTLTLRDSPNDIINVTVWGGVEFINRYFRTFKIGQVVEVINGKIQERKMGSKNEMYTPTATSPFTIVVNEGSALIQLHDSPACPKYLSFFRMIPKPISEVKSLDFILANIDEMQNVYVNILVVVTFVGQAQDIVSREGKKFVYRIFDVTDRSTDQAVQLRLWEEEWIRLSEVWEPNQTILFISDAHIDYDKYKKKNALIIARKTLITENPDIPEAAAIRNAIRSKPGLASVDPFSLPNPKMITDVMTIQEITDKLNQSTPSTNSSRLQLLTLLYANITEINLDAEDVNNIVFTKCALCKKIVGKGHDSCMNLECPSGNGSQVPRNVIVLNLKVHLKDHTGYLIGCRLFGATAENSVGKTATEIQQMSLEERTNLKWNLIFSNYVIRLQILGPTSEYPRAIYNILSIEPTESQDELANFFNE